MDLGFSPHLLAYVNFSPPPTRLKDRDELNLSYGFNQSYHTPLSKNVHPVSEIKTFSCSVFGSDQSHNKTGKETEEESSQSLWNSKISSPTSHEALVICGSEDEFLPFISSSPNLDPLKTVETTHSTKLTTGDLKLFTSNSQLKCLKNSVSENSTIFKNDSLNLLNQGFVDGNSHNSENKTSEDSTFFEIDSVNFLNQGFVAGNSQNPEYNSFEDSTFYENDSQIVFYEQPLKPLQPFYETKEASRQVSLSENTSLNPVSEKPDVLENRLEVFKRLPAVPSATSCTHVPVSSNTDSCILWSSENNKVLNQVNSNESNIPSQTLDCFQVTKNSNQSKDYNIDIPLSSNKLFRKQFLKNIITILKTLERRCSILNSRSEDTFEIPTSVGGSDNLELDLKYDIDSLENRTRVLQNSANNFGFENKYDNTLEEDIMLFRNNGNQQQFESAIRTEVDDIFHNDACDLTFDNMGIESRLANTTNVIFENVCCSKSRSELRDSWIDDCSISSDDQLIAAANIRENVNFKQDSRFCCKDGMLHPVNNTNVMSENVCQIKYRNECRVPLKTNCGKSIFDKAVEYPCIGENLKVENVSESSRTTDRMIMTCKHIGQLGKHMTPILNIKTPESKISQINVNSFMKDGSLLRNDFSSQKFIGVIDRTLCSVESFRTEQISLQVVSCYNKVLQASIASKLEFSSNLDFIGKRGEFDYLELSNGNTDFMFEENNGKYSLNERELKPLTICTKKCITFPSISCHQSKGDELPVRKKEIDYDDTSFKSKVDENDEYSSEIDLDDFVSASECYSSSSEVFYDMEEFGDPCDSGSIEEENYRENNVKNYLFETPFPDFKNESVLQDGKADRCKLLTSSVTKCSKSVFQNGKRDCNKPQTFSSTKNNTTSDLFNPNEPVIIKYLNEYTQQIEEMLIYPIEYHEKLSRKINREELREKLIENSKVYDGKPVGVILNIRDIRKKRKPIFEETDSTAKKFKEMDSEGMNILPFEQSLPDYRIANSLSDWAFGNCGKQVEQSCEGGHQVHEDYYAYTVSCPRKLQQNETDSYEENVQLEVTYAHTFSYPRKLHQNETGNRKKNVQPEVSYAYTVSWPRKLQQIEMDSCKENVQLEEVDISNPFNSKICKHQTILCQDNAVHLTENTNVYSNDHKTVVSSICKSESQKVFCFPSPIQKLEGASSKSTGYGEGDNAYSNDQKTFISPICRCESRKAYCFPSSIQKLHAVSSKSTNYCQRDEHRHWLHTGDQPLKNALNSSGTANSRKFCTIAIHSTKQRDLKILRKVQRTDNFTKYPMESGFLQLEGNLMYHSGDCSSSRGVQKSDSFSNKHLNDSERKGSKKTVSLSKKRINIEEIISSDFKTHFQSYAKRGGRLKSGSVISKSNSNYWLKKVIHDEKGRKMVDEAFSEVARKKIVLNICDYIQYLIIVSRRVKIPLRDLVQQLKTVDISGSSDSKKRMDSTLSNLSGDRSFKSHNRSAKQLVKVSLLQAPEQFSSYHQPSTPRKIFAHIQKCTF